MKAENLERHFRAQRRQRYQHGGRIRASGNRGEVCGSRLMVFQGGVKAGFKGGHVVYYIRINLTKLEAAY
jgi:hypothetical protein